MKMKNIPHSYNINRPTSRHGRKYIEYKKYLSRMMLICIKKKHLSIFEAQFIKKLSNTKPETKPELKRVLLIKKACINRFISDNNSQ